MNRDYGNIYMYKNEEHIFICNEEGEKALLENKETKKRIVVSKNKITKKIVGKNRTFENYLKMVEEVVGFKPSWGHTTKPYIVSEEEKEVIIGGVFDLADKSKFVINPPTEISYNYNIKEVTLHF